MTDKRFRRIIAFITALTMCTTTLAGCSDKDNSSSGDDSSSVADSSSQGEETNAEGGDVLPEEPDILASSITFAKSGSYTTTVSSEKVDLSGLTADNVEVRYIDNAELSDDSEEGAEEAPEAVEEPTYTELVNDIYTLNANVDNVTKNGDGWDISFTDEGGGSRAKSVYLLVFKDIEESVPVYVDFPEITLTPDVDMMYVSEDKLKVTLTVEGSEFEDDMTEDSITLGDSFEGMSFEVISSSANNLTLQLNGTPGTNAAGAYQWGRIFVSPYAIKDGYAMVDAKVAIGMDYVGLDAKSLALSDGKITADLLCYGSLVDVDKLTKDNVKIDGVKVESVKKADDNTVKLTMSADGVKSVNDFAKLTDGKAMVLDGYEDTVSLSQAEFYPVFDYVEEKGDDLDFTLILYSVNGAFDDALSIDRFSFADGFEGAKADSVSIGEDGNATLNFSVPANGMKADELKLDGTVTIAEGAMINDWNEKTTKAFSYTRDYSNESMGRAVTLNTETLLEIKKYTKGRDSVFGELCYWGGNIATGISAGISVFKTIFQMAGVLKTEHQEVMEQLELINGKLDNVLDNQRKMMVELDKIAETINEIGNDDYQKELSALNADISQMEDMLHLGAMYLALEDAVADGKLDKMPRSSEFDDYEEYLPDTDDMTEEKMKEYNERLIDYIIDRSKNEKDPEFDDFADVYKSLKANLGTVADRISRYDSLNPITRYDTICSYRYNFDTQCYDFRLAERVTAAALLARGLSIVALREKVMSYPKESTYKNYKDRVQKAMEWIDQSYDKIGIPASEVVRRPVGTQANIADPAKFAFCYITGTKVFYAICTPWNYGSDAYHMFPSLSHHYEFPDEDLAKFKSRSVEHKDDIYQELKSAGLETNDRIITNRDFKSRDNLTAKTIVTVESNYSRAGGYTGSNYRNYKYCYLVPFTGEIETLPKVTPGNPLVSYKAYVEGYGWMKTVTSVGEDVQTAGTLGQSKRLEALCIIAVDENNEPILQSSAYMDYCSHDIKSWYKWVDSNSSSFAIYQGKYSGLVASSLGSGTRMESIMIKVKDKFKNKYDVAYRVYKQDEGWLDWVANGETAGDGNDHRIEAIEIKLVEHDPIPTVTYQAYSQDFGWTSEVTSSVNYAPRTGTIGLSKRMEALAVALVDENGKSMAQYRAYVQDIGWQNWVDTTADLKDKNKIYAGTIGQSKRIEGIDIKLKDEYAKDYDIEYRAYMQNHGWGDWVKNGQTAGIISQSLRMEAIEIRLVKK